MKNLIAFLLYCLSVTAMVAQVSSQSRITVLNQTATETVLQVSLSGADRPVVTTPLGEACIVTIDEGTPLLQAGAPDLPKLTAPLMIPAQGAMQVEITASEYQDFENITVAPSKGNLMRTVDPATVPFLYGESYDKNEFFPGKLAALQDPFILRAVRGQGLWIYPVQYNPVTKTLRVYTNITLRVYRTADEGLNELFAGVAQPSSIAFGEVYRHFFLNTHPDYASKVRNIQNPDQMLVIAKDEFVADLQPLIEWKRQMGIHTTVVTTSEVAATQPADLYNFVKNYYLEHGISYLMLVGDEYAIEPMVRPGSNYSCDNCLGYMEGNDHFPEILVGRLNATTSDQLKLMVTRNLDYEKTPLVDSTFNWCATGMASSSDQGAGIGDDGQADWQQGNEWKTKHLQTGFEKYWEFYDGNHGADSPTPGDESADQPGDPTNTPLVQLMNSRGVSLYNYCGHGWEQGLVSGNFNVTAANALRNTHRYPIVVAVACCAGNFTNNSGGDCLGEALQRAGNSATGEAWGAIAGFFSSDFQSWAPPMEGQDGMNQFLLDAGRPSVSSMEAFGNAWMIAAYGQGGIDMADVWNPFCDPTTIPRTQMPQVLTATHDASAFIGATTISVHCPVEGALVSLYWQGQTLAVATVENGIAVFNFPAISDVGVITVTATQYNYTPYQGSIVVTPASGAFVVSQAVQLDDTTLGNHNDQADYGETLLYNVSLSNVGQSLAAATSATFSATDPYVTIIDWEETFGDLAVNESVQKDGAFAFKVAPFIPDGHVATFQVHIVYNDTAYYDTYVAVVLNAPKLTIGQMTMEDGVGGDGDGKMESGETVKIRIPNTNAGHSVSPNAIGVLTATSPWVTVLGPANLGALAPGTTATEAVFNVKISPDAPDVTFTDFNYELQADLYSVSKNFGSFLINPIIETFESNGFTAFPWEMSGNKPWVIVTVGAFTGTHCSRSGIINHGQKSEMNMTLDFSADGTVSFARRVSSELDYDFLRFLIDGEEVAKWSGTVPWSIVQYPITAGGHKLTWVYEKDNLGTAGSDRAWVDEISLPPYQVVVATNTPEENDFNVSVQPNPTSGRTWLQLDMPQAQQLQFRLYDVTGKLVQEFGETGKMLPGSYKVELDLTSVAPGIYFVQVKGSKETKVLKVVKGQN